jgi:hypothetical protein
LLTRYFGAKAPTLEDPLFIEETTREFRESPAEKAFPRED